MVKMIGRWIETLKRIIKNMDYETLKKKYKPKTVGEGWFLLKSNDALELISEGLENNLKLGIVEGFLRSSEGAFEPRQEYGSGQYQGLDEAEYNEKTIDLIKESSEVSDLYFEVWMS